MQRPFKLELDDRLLEQMAPLLQPYLHLTGGMRRERPHILLEVSCDKCGKKTWKRRNSLMQGTRQKGCDCQNGGRWNRDPRVNVLRNRYHAIEQRCTPGNPTAKAHGDKGVENRFSSMEHFIKYVLESLPCEDYSTVQFDRIDTKGHYEPGTCDWYRRGRTA